MSNFKIGAAAALAAAALFLTACSGGNSVTTPDTEPAPEVTQEQEAPAAEVGTRDNPAPIGSAIEGDDWTVVVNSFTADANQMVADANQFNEAAPAGSHYAAVNYTVTYSGAESGIAAEVSVALVASTGEVVNSYDSLVVLTDSIGIDEMYAGGSATGTAAFVVPDGAEVLIRVRPGMFGDETFVATQ